MGLNKNFDNSFDAFLAAWVRHQELRSGGSLAELASSRFELDELRYRVLSAR